MNILKNKYFILGNLAFIVLAIPVVMYLVKGQTITRSGAATNPSTSIIKKSSQPIVTKNETEINNSETKQSIITTKNTDSTYAIVGVMFIILAFGVFMLALRTS